MSSLGMFVALNLTSTRPMLGCRCIFATYVVLTMAFGYSKTLDNVAKSRYDQKLGVVGLTTCPYDLPADTWKNDPTKWPNVLYPHIFSYLIKTPGVYTSESMENFKSLDAHNFFISGWVQTVQYFKPTGTTHTILTADVRPSWRVTELPHHPWVAIAKTGKVVTAHCDCMAGLGESCSHIGALLFKIEAAVRNGYTRQACTDVPCEWNKCFVKAVKAAPISAIEFYKTESKERLRNRKRPKRERHEPAPEENQIEFLKNLAEKCEGEKPVGLSIFKETFNHFVSKDVVTKQKLPKALKHLYNAGNSALSSNELQEKCTEVFDGMKASEAEINFLCDSTVNQSDSVIWHEQRVGRITASVAHSVVHTNLNNPSQSLIRKICHPSSLVLNTPAVQWGKSKESNALETYKQVMSQQHSDLQVQNTGMRILPNKSFIGATPDGLFSCTCCGSGVIEIKCPYKFRDSSAQEMMADKDFYLSEMYQLKESHPYFSQVQLQMLVFGLAMCHFVVYTNNACIITTVQHCESFTTAMCASLEKFWRQHCLPELLTHQKLNEPSNSRNQSTKSTSSDELYCFCQTPGEVGDMIGCDSITCQYKWFHYDCVKIKRAPKGKWYCKECKKQNKKKMAGE